MKSARVLMLLIAALIVAACGAANRGQPSGSGSPSDGGVLTVAGTSGIDKLDPDTGASVQWDHVLDPLVWDGLMNFGRDGQAVPGLAASWKASDDRTKYTFSLRKGVKFQNGRAVTAKDIKWNIERVLQPKFQVADNLPLSVIKKVETPDQHTVVIDLSQPSTSLPDVIGLVRIMAPESVNQVNSHPVGTGPFRVASFSPNNEVRLVRWAGAWRPAHLDGINIVTVKDMTSGVTAVQTGSIDVLWGAPFSTLKSITASGQIKLVKPKFSSVVPFLGVDNSSPPFNDVRARQALAYALDRETVAKTAYFGLATPAQTNNLLPQGSPAFNSSTTGYNFDLKKAAKLFAEAGVTKGTTLTWWGIAGSFQEWTTEAQILQSDLKKIGINLVIKNNESGTWAAKFYPAPKKYPGYIIPNQFNLNPTPTVFLSYFKSGSCSCNFNNDQYDALLQKANSATDPKVVSDAEAGMQKILNDQVPDITTVNAPIFTAIRSNVSNAWESPRGNLDLSGVALTSSR